MPKSNDIYTVKVTAAAWEILISHARFLANVSVSAAESLVDTFVETTKSLSSMPERNLWLEHDAIPFRKYRKLLFGKRYLALYEIRENTIYITAVVDCRQEYTWLIQ